ncbi:putative RNA recognition motif domain, nucleotide-binding alpha-beta plait domain superfamily [Helianthus annuus]|uniref:RNA recognition motif domain, nucleotide-binding alpha-beta plait domain superfamily n=1 Tax=Helianthus annuus TaxID=4232 RepID=A0A9K3JCU0_HELAN|nr:putative RNA recognition motif domain, nucleotide-binding alpha-beta plait domain superfamily [Helianthus annuus]
MVDLSRTTTFFISNLPDWCDSNRLWDAFKHYQNLEDAFVPKKRDAGGNRFGFIRLSNLVRTKDWVLELSKISIDGAKLGVNVAKFQFDGTRTDVHGNFFPGENGQKFQGRSESVPHIPNNKGVDLNQVSGSGDARAQEKIGGTQPKVAPLNFGAWAPKIRTVEVNPSGDDSFSVFGDGALVVDFCDVGSVNNFLRENIADDLGIVEMKYLGGVRTLINFTNWEVALAFKNNGDRWCKWISKLVKWEGQNLEFQRIAWLSIVGVPMVYWDGEVFNSIGKNYGKIVAPSEASLKDVDISVGMVGVLVHHGSRINEEIRVLINGAYHQVWITETDKGWQPINCNESGGVEGDVDVVDSDAVSSDHEVGPLSSSGESVMPDKGEKEDRETVDSYRKAEDRTAHRVGRLHGNQEVCDDYGEKIEKQGVGSLGGGCSTSNPKRPEVGPSISNFSKGPVSLVNFSDFEPVKEGDVGPFIVEVNNSPVGPDDRTNSDPFNLSPIIKSELKYVTSRKKKQSVSFSVSLGSKKLDSGKESGEGDEVLRIGEDGLGLIGAFHCRRN